MDEEAIYEKLRDVFRDTFDDSSIEICSETTAEDIDDWDSIAHVQLMIAVEEAFGIKITTSQLARLHTVADLVSLLCEKQRFNL